jgi:hypothetical protein
MGSMGVGGLSPPTPTPLDPPQQCQNNFCVLVCFVCCSVCSENDRVSRSCAFVARGVLVHTGAGL